MKTTPVAQKWFAVEITADPEAAEALEYAFNSLDSLGTEINHLRKNVDDSVIVVGYFHDLPDEQMAQDEVQEALRIYDLNEDAIRNIERREIENQDWLSEWKKHWKPSVVGNFVISPPWELVDDPARIAIYIDPNMAFGTGTHETTQLCLKGVSERYIAGESFLDVGTGTGILSIAAAKVNVAAGLVEASIYACDTDKDSIGIAIDNGALSNVSALIDFEIGTISDDTPVFDFVCANLTLDVILPNLSLLIAKSRRMLVMSGILVEQEISIRGALAENGFSEVYVERAGEWIAVVVPGRAVA